MGTVKASDLNRIAAFYEPVEDVGADGQLIQSWRLHFTVTAHVHYLCGSEVVMQARMQSKRPVIITVRRTAQAQGITSEWRAKVDGRTFQVREDPRPDQARRVLAMLAEA